jgi:DNA modification methylase
MNKLYYGDNLDILRRYIKDETVDLIYLDPPFNSNATYNVLFGSKDGTDAAAQIQAFDDTWHWDTVAAESFREVVEQGGDVSRAMQAFRLLLNDSDMLAYLSMMAPRLVEMHRVLKPTGSIYLHCDPTASHYLKILMDAVFGADNFLNEIIWSYKRYTAASTRFQRLHDVIFFYGKSDKTKINDIREPYGEKSGKMDSHYKQDEDGQWFRWQKRKGEEPYKIYLSKGRRVGDVWEISIINASAKERLGYPTQKPEELLERIIQASSKEGDLVLDPFCGCGTTVAVAQRLNRAWIGIDITHLAINLMKRRLQDAFGEDLNYDVIGEPVSLEGAEALAREDPYQFQWWALGLVGARPADEKKGADAGIDGRIYFHDEAKGPTKQVIISVKAGKPHLSYMRDLRGVVDRENAEIGVLITMHEPTQPMRAEAASGGFYESQGWGETYPRLQILTIEELLDGKQIDMPPISQVSQTYKRAPRHKGDESRQLGLLGEDQP